MKHSWTKFAPLGLYLALAGALAGAGFFIVQRQFNLAVQISLGVVVIGLATFTLLDPRRVRTALTGRQARYGSNALLMGLAFIGILLVVNYIAYTNSLRWDLTENKQHTLAPESLETLNSLQQPVVAEAFYSSRYPYATDGARILLQSYQENSKGNFKYAFIDPDADPIKAQAAQVLRDGTIVLKMNDRQEKVTYPSEEEITGALIRLANPGERSVYFLTGHGERDPQAADQSSYSQVKSILESKNYTVKSLNLLNTASIPDNALTIIIAGSRKPLSDKETDTLKDYLAGGGAVVWLVEPDALSESPGSPDPLAAYVASAWGINLANDLAIDPNVNPPLIAVADSYGNHTITQKMLNMASLFPTARSIQTDEVPEDVHIVDLVKTSAVSWGETNIPSIENGQYQFDQDDIQGPLTLAVAADNQTTKARVAVVGDADFGSDGYYQNLGNGDFIINLIDWAAGQENLLNLTPKQTTQRILVPPKETTIGLLFLGLICAVPGVVVAAGIVTWAQRRKRG